MFPKLTILNCGSAKPTDTQSPSSQIFHLGAKDYLIDCGEGTQLTMAQMGILPPSRLNNIFISHLHADHCLGLIGLLSTLGMLHRTADINIFAPAPAKKILQPQLDFFCDDITYKININEINPRKNEIILEDNTIRISTIPLKHKVPCCGYLFEEQQKLRHYCKDIGDRFNIPIAYINKIKQGEDYITEQGDTIPNSLLTTDPEPPFRYAYCSDTAYYEKIIPIIEGVDCLYHEATFLTERQQRAKETGHSTATQAATIAKMAKVKQLIIGHFSSRYRQFEDFLKEAQEIFPNTRLATKQTIINF